MLSSIVIDHIGAAAWRESRRLGMSPTKHSKPPWVAKLSVTGSHLERRFADGVRDEAGASADGRVVPVYFHLDQGVYEYWSFGRRGFVHVSPRGAKEITGAQVRRLLGVDAVGRTPRMKNRNGPATERQHAAIKAVCDAVGIHVSRGLRDVFGKYKIGGWRLTKAMASEVIDTLQDTYGRVEIVSSQDPAGD